MIDMNCCLNPLPRLQVHKTAPGLNQERVNILVCAYCKTEKLVNARCCINPSLTLQDSKSTELLLDRKHTLVCYNCRTEICVNTCVDDESDEHVDTCALKKETTVTT